MFPTTGSLDRMIETEWKVNIPLHSFFYAQPRAEEYAAKAAHGARGEQGRKTFPCSIAYGHSKEDASEAGGCPARE